MFRENYSKNTINKPELKSDIKKEILEDDYIAQENNQSMEMCRDTAAIEQVFVKIEDTSDDLFEENSKEIETVETEVEDPLETVYVKSEINEEFIIKDECNENGMPRTSFFEEDLLEGQSCSGTKLAKNNKHVSKKKRNDANKKDEYLKCHLCNMIYTVKSLYIRHLQIKHNYFDIKNNPLLNYADSETSEDTNEKKFVEKKKYNCSACNKVFQTRSGLEIHNRIHTGDRPYQCEFCHKTFIDPSNLSRHRRIHNGEKPYECDICHEKFGQLNYLKKHKQNTDFHPYKCQICDMLFAQSEDLNVHMIFHAADKLNTDSKPTTIDSITQEIEKLQNPKKVNTKIFQCNECGRIFKKKYDMENHSRTHTSERPFKCETCDKAFKHPSNLNKHMLVHSGIKPYACDICQKSFTQQTNLNKHRRTHSGEKPYQCEICQKCFGRKTTLAIHKHVHSGKKPFECEICHKSFTLFNNLKMHQRIHSGERPHKCDVCDKTFSQISNLKLHQRTHSGEKPYACDICLKTFSQICNLKIHKRIHSGEKPFSCDLCQKTFSQIGNWQMHNKRMHNNEKK